MKDSTYKIIKVLCLVVIAISGIYIGIQLTEIKDYLWDLVKLSANS